MSAMSFRPITPHANKQAAAVAEQEQLTQPLLASEAKIVNAPAAAHPSRASHFKQQPKPWQAEAINNAAMVGGYEQVCRGFLSAQAIGSARLELQHRLPGQLQRHVGNRAASSPTGQRISNALALLAEKISYTINASQQAIHATGPASALNPKTLLTLVQNTEDLLLDFGNLTLALHTLKATQDHQPPLASAREQQISAAVASATNKLKALTDPEVIRLLMGNTSAPFEGLATVRNTTPGHRWRTPRALARSDHPPAGDNVVSLVLPPVTVFPLFMTAPANRSLTKADINGLCLQQLLACNDVPQKLTLFDAPHNAIHYTVDLFAASRVRIRFGRNMTSFSPDGRDSALKPQWRSTSRQLACLALALPVRAVGTNGVLKESREARQHAHENTPSSFWQRMMARGFGQSSFSKGLGMPFVLSRQKTRETINQRKIALPHEGAQQDNPAGLPPLRRHINLDQLGTAIDLPADHPISNMRKSDYLHTLSNDALLFPDAKNSDEHAQLMGQLHLVEQHLRDEPDQPTPLQMNQDGALLVRALSAACAATGGPNTQHAQLHAARALACLRKIDLAGSLCKPAFHRAPPSRAFTDNDHALAWRTAQMLAKTPAGMQLLTKLTLQATATRHPSVIEQETQMLKLFLTAGAELDIELKAAGKTGVTSPTPAGLLSYAERRISQLQPGQNSVLVKAISAIPAHLRQCRQFAANAPFQPMAADPHRHDWAIGVLRNGMTTDVAGSPFCRIEDRLVRKIAGKWVDLATSETRTRWQRVMTGMSPLRHKYPFNAFKKTDGSFKNVTQGSTMDRRHMRHASEIVEALLERPASSAHASDDALRRLVRLAFLKEWKTKRIPTLLEGDQCDQQQLQAMADTLAATPGVTANKAKVSSMLQAENKRYLPELLDQWLMDTLELSGPATAEQMHQYAVSMARVKGATTAFRMGQMTRENLANSIADLIRDELELGAGLTLTNGGTVGASTKGISQLIVGALGGWIVRVSVFVRMHRLRHAALEFKLSSAGVELRAGSHTINSKTAGISTFFGLNVNALNILRCRVGGGVDTAIAVDKERFSGVVLRLPRGKNGIEEDPAVRARFAEVVRRLLLRDAGASSSINAPGSDGASPLKNLLQQFSDLSVNLVGQALGDVRHVEKNLEIAARAGIGAVALGPTAAISTDHTAHNERYIEEQGRVRIEKITQETRRAVNLNARAFSGFPMDRIPGGAVATLPPTLTLGDINTDIWGIGNIVKHNLIFQDGQIDPRSFVIEAYGHLNGFIDHIVAHLDVWCAARARKFFPAEYDGGPDRRQRVIDEEHRRISHFIARARERVATTQAFYSNLDIKPAVANDINRWMAMSIMMDLNGETENSEKIRTYCRLRLEEKASWEETNLLCRETVSEQISRPFQAGVTIRTVSNIVTTNLLDII
jgi:hypothetical protein